LESKKLHAYEYLLSKNLLFGPHEDLSTLYDNLNSTESETLRGIHFNYTGSNPKSHVNVIMANSYAQYDGSSEINSFNLMLKAYNKLNENYRLSTILKTVAATKMFRVIFDFNSDDKHSMCYIPVFGAKGTLFVSGKIYIGAKKLLDKNTEHEVYGNIAHEFCHYAMQVAYNNKSNPYNVDDDNAIENFAIISKTVEQIKDKEPIIRSVFNDYVTEFIPSELIVRPAEIIAVNICKPDILMELISSYEILFEHFDEFVIPAMKEAIALNERRFIFFYNHVYGK
jgi:hypothetical protein